MNKYKSLIRFTLVLLYVVFVISMVNFDNTQQLEHFLLRVSLLIFFFIIPICYLIDDAMYLLKK